MKSLAELFAGQLTDLAGAHKNRYREKVAEYGSRIKIDPDAADLYYSLARCHIQNDNQREGLRVLRRGLDRFPAVAALHREYILTLNCCGQTEAALAAAEVAATACPGETELLFFKYLLLPAIYETQDEVERHRCRFSEGLESLLAEVPLTTQPERQAAMKAVQSCHNFSLSFQGLNDRGLQVTYGALVHKIMTAYCPTTQSYLPGRAELSRRKPRVGYVSSFFCDHATSRYFRGWLSQGVKDRMEVNCYHLGTKTDYVTDECRRVASVFYTARGGFDDVYRRIRDDHLDVLVYLDIGLAGISTQLAALRLAPTQCATLAHPMTSGLPTIDYFLSSAAMESEVAQSHYSEKLVLLPNLGIHYERPILPRVLLKRTRSDFGLRADAVLYFCCQMHCKYLPRYDHIFAGIAQRCPDAQFVFFVENEAVADVLRRRLADTFQQSGLPSEQHCVFLPYADRFTFWNLSLLSDVFLDSIGWSGGNTTIEAIACGLPVVTYPTELLRGRQSYGMLRLLGVTDTVARDEAHYIEIAIRLGLEKEWRADIVGRMRQGFGALFGDRECVGALEDFLVGVASRSSVG